MPSYAFRCPACGEAFEVQRRMGEAGGPAPCPEDGSPAERVFTSPGLLRGATPGQSASPTPARRYWFSPFFPKDGAAARQATPTPRHVLPAGASKPASFRHFGHSHPAGTAVHTHRVTRALRSKGKPARG